MEYVATGRLLGNTLWTFARRVICCSREGEIVHAKDGWIIVFIDALDGMRTRVRHPSNCDSFLDINIPVSAVSTNYKLNVYMCERAVLELLQQRGRSFFRTVEKGSTS